MTQTESVVALSDPAERVLYATERFVLHEGAFRSSKTWTCLIKWRMRLEEYPGIALVMARWKEDDLNTKLIPDYRRVCALMGLPIGNWNASEKCFDFWNGSKLYAIHLKSSEIAAVHSKARGFTVSGVFISQLEEVPEDVAKEWMLRLSQPGFPHQFLADANPVHHGHYLADPEMFPEDNKNPDHLYVSASIWDNAHNLDASTIQAAESMYPIGHPMRGPKLEGKRGANLEGTPVYSGCFDQVKHVANGLEPYRYCDLLVGWDFGAKHPVAVFAQMVPWGGFWIHGGIMGTDVPLETFAPKVLDTAKEWFPDRTIVHCGDPAGSHRNSQGVSVNAVSALRDIGIGLNVQPDSNTNTVRAACVQTLQSYMLASVKRFVTDGTEHYANDLERRGPQLPARLATHAEPAFQLNPRFLMVSPRGEGLVPVILEALGAGYIWNDARHSFSQTDGNLRMPKKDGFFEHPMNATEYIIHNFWQSVRMPAAALTRNYRAVQKEAYREDAGLPTKAQMVALRKAQIDKDPDDHGRAIARWSRKPARMTGRR